MAYEDREKPAQPYDWQRIATEAAVVRNLEALGAVDLRRPARRPAARRTGFVSEGDPYPKVTRGL